MNIKEKFELIKRNAVEIIEEKELLELLKEKKIPVAYCGYEVSGEVHLGHVVTINKLIDLQKAGFKVIVLFADWHTWLNKKGSWEEIGKLTEVWKKAFRALDLKAEYVLGSSFQRNIGYVDDVLKMSLGITINRALRSMQEIARDIKHAKVSQVIYPLMQAIDIKALNVDVAAAGLEQRKIHMLAREILPQLNYKAPVCIHTPLIPSLLGPGSKMSSSVPESMISVRDSPKEIKRKIDKAYCPAGIVKENSILYITKLIIFPKIKKLEIKRDKKFGGNVSFDSYEKLEKEFIEKKIHPLDLKNSVSEYLIEIFESVRKVLL